MRADELRGALQRKGAGDGRADAVPGGGGDAALRERLAALGYASASLRTDPAAVLPDPKDKVSVFTALEVAKGLAVEGQLEAGIAAARKVVDADAAVMEAHIALGDWLRQAGRLGESIDAYQHALALRPDDDATLMPLVEACRAAGRPRAAREALAAFEAALTAQPRRPAAWYVLGTLSLELGDVRTAERALRRALELDPAMAPAQLQLASVSLRGHRLAEAEERVRAALRLDADVPSGQYTLGQALERLGRRVGRRRSVSRGTAVEPGRCAGEGTVARAWRSRRVARARAGTLTRCATPPSDRRAWRAAPAGSRRPRRR